MADLRTHNLTDEQATYDKDIYLPTDSSLFTNTKKIKVGTIYPKTFELSAEFVL